MALPTSEQLRSGALGISYRAKQLAEVAELIHQRYRIAVPHARFLNTIPNALVESALVNARVLAYFFTDADEVKASHFGTTWVDAEVVGLAAEVEVPISRHLSHASKGAKSGEHHPGAWPIVELAVVLVGALSRYTDGLDPESEESTWFVPSPTDAFGHLMAIDPLSSPTEISDNPGVSNLTRRLQAHLREQPHS